MKNIHIIPTDRPSRLYKFEDKLIKNDLIGLYDIEEKEYIAQHIYITSDEEIKEGDWFYNIISLKPEPFKACENGDRYVNCSKYSHYRIDCKKIILTTDQDLIKDGVQPIDDEFLEWFVKNPNCEEVKVVEKQHFEADKSKRKNPLNGVYYSYKIIVPKEELTISDEAKQRAKNYMSLKGALEPKQETLEEAGKNTTKKYINEREKQTAYLEFIEGAKWQQERMYTYDELRRIAYNAYCLGQLELSPTENGYNIWIQQFKKK